MRYLYTFVTLLMATLFAQPAFANTISKAKALTIAQQFVSKQTSLKSAQTLEYIELNRNIEEALYAFGAQNCFVFVAANDALPTIAAYSNTNSFRVDSIPDALEEWINAYTLMVGELKAGNAEIMQVSNKSISAIEPLLKTEWGQDYEFSNDCPKNYAAGCVAIGAAQIMKYYNYPNTGIGSHSYTWNNTTLSADFGSTTYDWDNMLVSYYDGNADSNQAKAVSTLSYHVGVAVDMNYTADGSGAQSVKLPFALATYFKYSKKMQFLFRDMYDSNDWMEMIHTELDAKRPIYYRGGNHAFVCDGIDADGLMHINWGWEGYCNGYFDINFLSIKFVGTGGGNGYYSNNQGMIIGFEPPKTDETDIDLQTTVLAEQASILCNKPQNIDDQIDISTVITNRYTSDFNGQIAIALMQNGKIWHIIDSKTDTIKALSNYTFKASCTIPDTLTAGSYQLVLCTQNDTQTDDTWNILNAKTGLTNYININVDNEKLTAEVPTQETPKIEALSEITSAENNISGYTNDFEIQLGNTSNVYYNGTIQFKLTDTANDTIIYTVKTSSLALYGKSQTEATYTLDFKNVAAGDYYLDIYYKKNSQYVLITPFNNERKIITVNETDNDYQVQLTEKINIPATINKDSKFEIEYGLENIKYTNDAITIRFRFTNNADALNTVTFANKITLKTGKNGLYTAPFSSESLDAGKYNVTAFWGDSDGNEHYLHPFNFNDVATTIVKANVVEKPSTDTKLTVTHSNETIIINNVKVGSEIEIYNIIGQPIDTKTATQNKVKISTSNMPKGIYIVNINDKQNRRCYKIRK